MASGPSRHIIMKRAQVYLRNSIWETLRVRSREQGTSVSGLVCRAVCEKYGDSLSSRRDAMQALVGLRKNRRELRDTATYVRKLRKGSRTQKTSL